MSSILSEENHRLIEAAMLGDQNALSELLTKSQTDLKRFARRTCANAQDAEDAVQVALWQMHRKVGTLRVAKAFASWLFRIVERECSRLFRLNRENVSLEENEWEAIVHPPIPHDLRADLSAAIGALPEIYREVLILRDIEELTAPEVSAMLNISIEAVKSRLHRARGMVRERLIQSGYWVQEP